MAWTNKKALHATENTAIQPATENTSVSEEGKAERGSQWFPGKTFDLAPANADPVPSAGLAGTGPAASTKPVAVAPAAPEGGTE